MTISMYQASASRFIPVLNNLSVMLDKAAAHCEAKKIDPAAITAFRLFPDMYPMYRQVHVACDASKNLMARLAGVEIPKHEDVERTFPELKARIAKTIAFIKTIQPAQIDGTEEKEITLKVGGRELKFTGMQYLLAFAQPNFYFHVTTAYNILRHNGVEIGKMDYLSLGNA